MCEACQGNDHSWGDDEMEITIDAWEQYRDNFNDAVNEALRRLRTIGSQAPLWNRRTPGCRRGKVEAAVRAVFNLADGNPAMSSEWLRELWAQRNQPAAGADIEDE
jgi:hypothetical protein